MSPWAGRLSFQACAIQGVVEGEPGCESAAAIGRAFGDVMCPQGDGRFVVGHDARQSSTSLAESLSVGLRSGGHHVTHIGRCTTPMLGWYGAEAGFDGSIMITGSHLPPEYNGFKLCARDALPVCAGLGLEEVASQMRLPFRFDRPCTSRVTRVDPMADYTSILRARLRGVSPMKLAVDAGNGVGGIDTRKVFEHFPHIWLHEINFNPDGRFPHRSPDPFAPGALRELSGCVLRHGCPFGLAFDGDADRAAVVDEQGRPVPAEEIGGLLALGLVGSRPGASIVHEPGVARPVLDALQQTGAVLQPVEGGQGFIRRAMQEREALFGFDRSGRYYFADLHGTENPLRALIELGRLLSERGGPLSTLLEPLRRQA